MTYVNQLTVLPEGLEPSWAFARMTDNHLRLPVPPRQHVAQSKTAWPLVSSLS